MQIHRLLGIVNLLLERKNVTARELAEHFEVSSRTILRDIDVLSYAGIPVYTSQGKGGGIALCDGYVLNKTIISEGEQDQILFALQGLAVTGQIESSDILRKLRGLFQKPERDWILVDFSRWGNAAEDRDRFGTLKESLLNERAVSFVYSDTYGKTTVRTVYPLRLVFKSRAWYLQAYCLSRLDYRTFKINRMRDISICADSFLAAEYQAPDIESAEYNSPNLLNVVLRFDPQAAYRVYDEFTYSAVQLDSDGYNQVSFRAPNDSWLYEYILSFGGQIEIIAPQSLRDSVVKCAEDIIKNYL